MGASAAFVAASALNTGSSLAGSYAEYKASKREAKQYQLQSEQLELQKDILADQYRTKRNQLQGSAIAKAAASGVKVSGSVASSISNSLTELGMEESYKKFNINMEKNNLQYKSKAAKIEGKQKLISGLIRTGSSALGSYAAYQQYWGTPTIDATGQGKTGGNVFFTNASYAG